MSYDNTNSGALFQNEKKEKETQPDFTGKINIDGVEKRLAGWKKESKNGKKFLSLKISDFTGSNNNANNNNNTSSNDAFDDDNIPF
jgi:uncharacterized protein (DUF736 family)